MQGLHYRDCRRGEHVPDLPFVIVNREGCHVDFTGIGKLWDAHTVASVRWARRDNGGVAAAPIAAFGGSPCAGGGGCIVRRKRRERARQRLRPCSRRTVREGRKKDGFGALDR